MSKCRWTPLQLRLAVQHSRSKRQVLISLCLKPTGGNYRQLDKYLIEQQLSTSHFSGQAWNKGMIGLGKPKKALCEILTKNSFFQSYKLKQRLFQAKLKQPKCELCGWSKKTIDGRIPVELDHINGDPRDNRLENLRILCPNCHSLQSTHRGKNKRSTAQWWNR